jgi:hypothetical protein
MDTTLNFLNCCEDQPTPSVLIFQHGSGGSGELAVAWKVIRNCSPGWRHPFVFSHAPTLDLSDAFGNHLAPLDAPNGSAFELRPQTCGRTLARAGAAAHSSEIMVRNAMPKGAYRANLYSDGLLLATRSGLAPGSRAIFSFEPSIRIGAVYQAREGSVLAPAAICPDSVELSLRGVRSADLVMRDDEDGDGPSPYRFTLENVELA